MVAVGKARNDARAPRVVPTELNNAHKGELEVDHISHQFVSHLTFFYRALLLCRNAVAQCINTAS